MRQATAAQVKIRLVEQLVVPDVAEQGHKTVILQACPLLPVEFLHLPAQFPPKFLLQSVNILKIGVEGGTVYLLPTDIRHGDLPDLLRLQQLDKRASDMSPRKRNHRGEL